MDTLHAIRRLRVVRDYRPDPLPKDVLVAIVDAGRHAGSSKNRQRWDFVLVQDRAMLARLAKVGPYGGHLADATAAVALVTPTPKPGDPLSVMWDLGRAAQNMTLAAWELGVGSCPITVYEHALCRELLGYPQDRHCEYVLALGRPADESDLTRTPRAGGRVPLSQVLHEERW